jgi:hypothetical protein
METMEQRLAVCRAWRTLSESREWVELVAPYLQAALATATANLSESDAPNEAMKTLGRIAAYQEILSLPQSMLAAAEQRERMIAMREEQERENERRRAERPFAKWRASINRR